jgi:DNA-binding MarR family transcriptional regulator/GNAT superfamily N-acetyltransferase
MSSKAVEQVRRFNRTVTQRVGALQEEYLSRDRPLGQARLLWEIGHAGAPLAALRARLDLDSGYLSRLLRTLEADGLVVVRSGSGDGRERTAQLTSAGRAEWSVLDARSDELAQSILTPLSAPQRDRLVAAMGEVQQLLLASMVEISVRPPADPHARFCIRSYFAELADRFEDGFDPAVSISADDHELTPPAGLLLIASLHFEPVGCGALKFRDGDVAEVKRMWIAPSTRGLGLGRRLLNELEQQAINRKVRILRLETNRSLQQAINLYRSAGYQEVAAFNDERYAHHWFEKRLDAADSWGRQR